MSAVLTVSQLNRYISFRMKEDKNLRGILIRGEISNFTNHTKTGNLYFTLKDGVSSVKAVMFANMASRLNFMPDSGMKVIISANVQAFERDGIYQLYVNDIQPDGLGVTYLAIEQLKERLSAEGIFDEGLKKPLPKFPKRLGIVTSPDGAALQDMLNIISRRYPIAEITIYPCLVQGEQASGSISAALKKADKDSNDIIIVGRGGGAAEDLMAFNTEMVARTVFSCVTPVVSAVGHETDTTVCDYAADLRAPTPSAAAELAVPELSVLKNYVSSLEYTLDERLKGLLASKRQLLEIKEHQLNAAVPSRKIKNYAELLDEKNKRLQSAYKNKLALSKSLLAEKITALDNLSPLKIMDRGYSLVYKGDILIKSASELKKDDNITVRLSNGTISATVTGYERK